MAITRFLPFRVLSWLSDDRARFFKTVASGIDAVVRRDLVGGRDERLFGVWSRASGAVPLGCAFSEVRDAPL